MGKYKSINMNTSETTINSNEKNNTPKMYRASYYYTTKDEDEKGITLPDEDILGERFIDDYYFTADNDQEALDEFDRYEKDGYDFVDIGHVTLHKDTLEEVDEDTETYETTHIRIQ